MTAMVHHFEQRDGLPVCKYCGIVKNADAVGPRYCAGKPPAIKPRDPMPLNDTAAMVGKTVYVVTVCDDDGTVQWQTVYASLFDADAVFTKKRELHGRLACLASRRVC